MLADAQGVPIVPQYPNDRSVLFLEPRAIRYAQAIAFTLEERCGLKVSPMKVVPTTESQEMARVTGLICPDPKRASLAFERLHNTSYAVMAVTGEKAVEKLAEIAKGSRIPLLNRSETLADIYGADDVVHAPLDAAAAKKWINHFNIH